jgi:hypothetical protein
MIQIYKTINLNHYSMSIIIYLVFHNMLIGIFLYGSIRTQAGNVSPNKFVSLRAATFTR